MMNPVILGAQVVLDLNVTDPVVAGLLIAMQVPLCSWTASNIQLDATALPLPLTASGPAITGLGAFTYADVNALASAICSAIGLTDPPGIAKAGVISQHYADTIKNFGVCVPAGLIAYTGPAPPPTGPVTGQGKMLLNGDFKFYEALGLTDQLSIDTWTTFGNTLKLHLHVFADLTPGTMMNPAGGGPVTGMGALA